MKKQIEFLSVALVTVSVFVLIANWYWTKLDNNNLMTTGMIMDCRWGGRGSPFFIAQYTFSIGSKKYSSSYQLSCKDFVSDSLKRRLIGLKVPVIYNPDEPWINTIVIEKKTFHQYDISIPDTLISVVDFLDCK